MDGGLEDMLSEQGPVVGSTKVLFQILLLELAFLWTCGLFLLFSFFFF